MRLVMPFLRETWDEMTARHERERRSLLDELIAQRVPVSEAARILGTDVRTLEEAIFALGIVWPAERACEAKGGA
jgi:transcriptional regulator with GAF, ATPase, and Fis domain